LLCEILLRLLFSSQPNVLGTKRRLPTSYVFELLIIRRWEQAGKPEQFSMKGAFKDVMTQLENFGNINAEWTDYYSRSDFPDACEKQRGK